MSTSGKIVNKGVWIEGLFLITISLFSLIESIRLILYTDPLMIIDWLGSGYYLLIISIGLLSIGILYIYKHRRELSIKKEKTNKGQIIRLISSLAALIIYLILISLTGYLIATAIFFIFMFHIFGIKSWAYNLLLSVVVSVVFYVIFIILGNVDFHKGIFFNL